MRPEPDDAPKPLRRNRGHDGRVTRRAQGPAAYRGADVPESQSGHPKGGSGRRFLRRRTTAESLNDFLLLLLIAALASAPLYYGGNRMLSWAANGMAFGILLIMFELGLIVSGGARAVALKRIWWMAALFGAVLAWIVLQAVPWTPASWHSPFWELAQQALSQWPSNGESDAAFRGSISVVPDEGWLGLIRLVSNAAAFYLGLQLCRDSQRAKAFAAGIVVVVTAYAIFGIMQRLFFPTQGLWGPKRHYLDFATSTFVNRNSFATFAGIGLVVACGLLLRGAGEGRASRAPTLSYRSVEMLERIWQRSLPLVVPMLVILVALLWSGSRAGTIWSLAGVCCLLALGTLLGRAHRFSIIAAAVLLSTAALGLMVYGAEVAERAEAGPEDLELRFAAYINAIRATLDQPWTGFGYGSFSNIYPQYRTDILIDQFWNYAHNTYIEIAFEAGIPSVIVVAMLVGGAIIKIFRNAACCQNLPMLSLIALSASVTVLGHALFDFSVQMQGVALLYWALMGAGLAQSWSRRIDTTC